jgi:hypothetical protein
MMKPTLLTLTFTALLSACVGSGNNPTEPVKRDRSWGVPPPSSSSSTNIDLSDPNFKQKLSKALTNQPEKVVVPLPNSVDPEKGEMPKPLNPWLAAIEESGGRVYYEPLAEDMSPFLLLPLVLYVIDLGSNLYQDYQKETDEYAAVQNYNARVCYRRDDNLVTKIVFVDRNKYSELKIRLF